jgi:hypothetical protein
MVHPFPAEASESLGQLSFRLHFGEVLREALQQARDGVLDPQWRETVATSSRLSGLQSNDPYGILLPVVTAIYEMPRAAWEPGHSPGWRTALDSWFDASRAALAEHRDITLTEHAKITRLGTSTTAAARISARSVPEAITKIADADARNDELTRQSLSMFIVQRDKLTASYGAALAAGGEQVDWRTWFEGRINTWDDDLAVNGARILVQQETSYLERLPTYW